MFCLRLYAVTTVIENELWNWGSRKGKKRMEFVGARLKSNVTNEDLALLKKRLSDPVKTIDARRLRDTPNFIWVRPIAVRCISGHSNGAVDLEPTAIAISEREAGHWRRVAHDKPTCVDLDCKVRAIARRSQTLAIGRALLTVPSVGQALYLEFYKPIWQRRRERDRNLCAHQRLDRP